MQTSTHLSTHKGIAMALIAALAMLAAPQIHAQGDTEADSWEQYDDIADWLTLRLKLTEKQEDRVLPIVEQSFQRQKDMLGEYGIVIGEALPKLSVKQREEIDAKMIGIRAETRAELVDILSADQLRELKQVQREYHKGFRDRLAEE